MFSQTDLGYASAIAWVTFLAMMTLTVFLFRSSRRWVYFPEDDEDENI
jgi:multiple sugar transport system permease protein